MTLAVLKHNKKRKKMAEKMTKKTQNIKTVLLQSQLITRMSEKVEQTFKI